MISISSERLHKVFFQIIFDSLLVLMALYFSYTLRLGYWYDPQGKILTLFLISPMIALPIFYFTGIYHQILRYIDINIFVLISKASLIYGFFWGSFAYFLTLDGVPRSVILLNIVFVFILLFASRVLIRNYFSRKFTQLTDDYKNVLIYGAGSAGRELLESFQSSKKHLVRGFIDDNKSLQNSFIKNLKVYPREKIQQLINTYEITEVVLALPSISSEKRKDIIDFLYKFSIPIKTLPNLSEFIDSKISFTFIKPIKISDLLGRKQIRPKQKLLKADIFEKNVLITGAGGTIGEELARQALKLGAKRLFLLDHNEFSLYKLQSNLDSEARKIVKTRLGSVLSMDFLENIFRNSKIETVFHAAAYKHVPLVEDNIIESFKNNVIGTYNVAFLAGKYNVRKFILISTDKAVRPTNIMGATKRLSEIIIKNIQTTNQSTTYSMVRFGNVLGSSGSVIPLFERQIKSGGPVTVTHREITRYFMTISEAVALVIQAGAMSKGNDVFLLDMGEPVKIDDLAKKMINLSGFTIKNESNSQGDIEIVYSGLRPGEKLYEELLIGDSSKKTEHKKIFKAEESFVELNLQEFIKNIHYFIEARNENEILKILSDLVDGFSQTK